MSVLIDVLIAAVGLALMSRDNENAKPIGALIFLIAAAMFAAHWTV